MKLSIVTRHRRLTILTGDDAIEEKEDDTKYTMGNTSTDLQIPTPTEYPVEERKMGFKHE